MPFSSDYYSDRDLELGLDQDLDHRPRSMILSHNVIKNEMIKRIVQINIFLPRIDNVNRIIIFVFGNVKNLVIYIKSRFIFIEIVFSRGK